MTNPTLSVAAPKQVGRVYRRPGTEPIKTKLTAANVKKRVQSGELCPSVTTIIGVLAKDMTGYQQHAARVTFNSGASFSEALKAADAYRDAAAERGTRIHSLGEELYDAGWLNGDRYDELFATRAWEQMPSWNEIVTTNDDPIGLGKTRQSIGYATALLSFLYAKRPRFTHSEATVYGSTPEGLPYAGTTDFIAEIDGRLVIGDWKCTSVLSPTVNLQLAAIKNATHLTHDFMTLEPMPQVDGVIAVRLQGDGGWEMGTDPLEDSHWKTFCHLRGLWSFHAFADAHKPEILERAEPWVLPAGGDPNTEVPGKSAYDNRELSMSQPGVAWATPTAPEGPEVSNNVQPYTVQLLNKLLTPDRIPSEQQMQKLADSLFKGARSQKWKHAGFSAVKRVGLIKDIDFSGSWEDASVRILREFGLERLAPLIEEAQELAAFTLLDQAKGREFLPKPVNQSVDAFMLALLFHLHRVYFIGWVGFQQERDLLPEVQAHGWRAATTEEDLAGIDFVKEEGGRITAIAQAKQAKFIRAEWAAEERAAYGRRWDVFLRRLMGSEAAGVVKRYWVPVEADERRKGFFIPA